MSGTRRNRWDPEVPWEVPRDLRWPLPAGMQWAAAGRCLRLGPATPAQVIRPEDWGDAVAGRVQAVALVSAIHAHALCIGHLPSGYAIYTRRPALVHMSLGDHLTVRVAKSRAGELWAAPLARVVGPPQPPAAPGNQPTY